MTAPPIIACPRCGQSNYASSPFCHACGMPMGATELVRPTAAPTASAAPPKPRAPRIVPWRLLASVIDHAVAGLLVGWPLADAFDGDTGWQPTVWLAIGIVYLVVATVWSSSHGLTIGKRLVGFQTVVDPARSSTPWLVVRRVLLLELLNVVLFLGAFSVLFRRDRRGWYEVATATSVVARPEISLVRQVLTKIGNRAQTAEVASFAPEPELAMATSPSGPIIEGHTQIRDVPRPSAPTYVPVAPEPEVVQPAPVSPTDTVIAPRVTPPVPAAPVPPVPVPPPAPVLPSPPPVMPLEHTRMVSRPEPTAPAIELAWWFTFDDGSRFQAHDSGLIGRDPAQLEGQAPAQLIAFPDLTRSISKTHLEFQVNNGLWIRDRGSTNGSALEIGGQVQRLDPWKGVQVPEGAIVHIGGRKFAVSRAAR